MRKKETIHIIYRALFPNGKSYIGQTSRPLRYRVWGHKSAAIAGQPEVFYRAIRKYGFENIIWETLEVVSSKEELNYLEKYYIKYFDTYRHSNGYNSTFGGDGFTGKHTKESREKQRLSKLGTGNKNINDYYLDKPNLRREIQLEWLKDPKNMEFAVQRIQNVRKELTAKGVHMGKPKIRVALVKDCAVMEFDSISDAAKFLNVAPSSLHFVFRGTRETVKGFKAYKLD